MTCIAQKVPMCRHLRINIQLISSFPKKAASSEQASAACFVNRTCPDEKARDGEEAGVGLLL
jgi:hypothetical protein